MHTTKQPLNPLSGEYLEQLYAQYLTSPDDVPEPWRAYFQQQETGAASVGLTPPTSGGRGPATLPSDLDNSQLHLARLQERVDQLVRNYRVRGHIRAQIDPLGTVHPRPPEMEPSYYGFTSEDLESPVSTRSLRGTNVQTLRDVIEHLEASYCGAIGIQFMHIDDLQEREWLQRRMEDSHEQKRLSRDEQIRILTKLTDAVIFEQFVRRKYVGMKSFSLEGAETLIPLLDTAIEKLACHGVREICMGMSHRGRLNVLANILGKRYQQIFREFEDSDAEELENRGDVKYHLGYHNFYTTASGREVHISLGFNPSHLEFVNPVTLGRCRAKQDRFGDPQRQLGAALLIHGDASFAGEGIVQESLNLSQLIGYSVGGTIHIVVNNQIGFTTTPSEGRSTAYATDVAKMLQIPIFHVNGEHPEAVARVVDAAVDFREKFQRDVVIDMYCFRRWGHNEGDEPAFTQPQMYDAIEQHPTVRDSYLERLLSAEEVTAQEAEELVHHRMEALEREWNAARKDDFTPPLGTLESMWQGFMGLTECFAEDVATGVDLKRLSRHLQTLTSVPEGFHCHRKLTRALDHRRAMANQEKPLDWTTAELLALATLAADGYRVRFSGQDSQRGTFSQRHAVLHDVENGQCYCPLQNISPDQASVEIINSPLSEAGVLGFEYGYSLAWPDGLVVWEAQFGDFANAAQVIIDQFIASAEDKWQHLSGLVMLLPHGYEGQGPEHSSARLERFLWLAADDNIQIVVPTTPAQYFHTLRRQVIRRWRKPLIVMTPKSLLRHPAATSSLDQLTAGRFQRVIPDLAVTPSETKQVLLCSGKIYYELLEARKQQDNRATAIVRIEQLYPFPEPQLRDVLFSYDQQTPVKWVQEEPANMGAWPFLKFHFGAGLFGRFPLLGVSRPPSSSPATGSKGAHQLEQQEIIRNALELVAQVDHTDNVSVHS